MNFFLISEKLFDKLGEGEDLADADIRLHRDEVVEVVRRLRRRDRRVRRRRLHPRAVGLLHVPSVRRERRQEGRRGHDAEKSVVFRIEDCVGPERLGDVLVEKRREREVGVQVEHEAALIRFVNENHVIIPNHLQ